MPRPERINPRYARYARGVGQSFSRWFDSIPRVTRALLVANVSVYVLQLMLGRARVSPLMLWPWDTGVDGMTFMPWQLLTYGFMHDSAMHLFFNMLTLFMFGAPLEHTWSGARYLHYYLICVAGAAVCQLALNTWMVSQEGMLVPTVGASGGVFGLLLAYGMLFPNNRIAALPFPIFLRARTIVFIYGAVALLFGITGTQQGVAHFAHLGGMVFGYLLIRYWRRPPGARKPPPRDRGRLRVVK